MSIYSNYNADQVEDLLSNFLINSWSYSKTTTFSRNEKEFERLYIYGERGRKSPTTVAGSAYHKALELFFTDLIDGVATSIIDMESTAYGYIDSLPANEWKLQKSTPSIPECQSSATKSVTSLIQNFLKEQKSYTENISEVVGTEVRCEEWLTINGVDIPLPCISYIDLIVRLNDGKLVMIDHKSKIAFTDDRDHSFTSGKQAITYVKNYETMTGETVDEFWFIENKVSTNKDGSPQLKQHRIILDKDTRTLYEAMLYEPLKRMIEAVSDPDYVYMINDNDNLCDKAELYDFWCKTMLVEIDYFNIPDNKKDIMAKRQKKIRDATLATISPTTISKFKRNAQTFIPYDFTNKDMTNREKIEHVLRSFGVAVEVAHDIDGYSSNTFLLNISAGVKIANILSYKLDIANALNVSSVRIGRELTVYEGKSYLFIEAPKRRDKDLLFNESFLSGEKLPIGVDNYGRTIIWDLNNHSTPHVLVCGATGSGKSVSIISTVEYAKLAGITDIVIFDPKYEFKIYAAKGVRVINEIEKIESTMKELVDEMHSRARSGNKSKTLIVFDEFADAVSAARSGVELDIKEEVIKGYYAPKYNELGELMPGAPKYELRVVGRLKSLEENLKIILQKGRSLGFRVLAATQRASTKVITGDAKVNFPVQICFRVPKELDSKVVLDESGAETLSGAGDGLLKSPEYMDIVRFQGFFKPQPHDTAI